MPRTSGYTKAEKARQGCESKEAIDEAEQTAGELARGDKQGVCKTQGEVKDVKTKGRELPKKQGKKAFRAMWTNGKAANSKTGMQNTLKADY